MSFRPVVLRWPFTGRMILQNLMILQMIRRLFAAAAHGMGNLRNSRNDELVKVVIPAKAGIQWA